MIKGLMVVTMVVAAVVMVSHSRLFRDGSGISHIESRLISNIFETCVTDRHTDGRTDPLIVGGGAKMWKAHLESFGWPGVF